MAYDNMNDGCIPMRPMREQDAQRIHSGSDVGPASIPTRSNSLLKEPQAVREMTPQEHLYRRASELREEADGLEALARALPGELSYAARSTLVTVLLRSNRAPR